MSDESIMRKTGKWVRNIPKNLALVLILFYRRCISPLTPACCRFYPTCSEYALTSFRRYGFIKGFWLSLKRICRCHPWNPGGYDPVP
jgi:putative membrane protein insertion efficiency factor